MDDCIHKGHKQMTEKKKKTHNILTQYFKAFKAITHFKALDTDSNIVDAVIAANYWLHRTFKK